MARRRRQCRFLEKTIIKNNTNIMNKQFKTSTQVTDRALVANILAATPTRASRRISPLTYLLDTTAMCAEVEVVDTKKLKSAVAAYNSKHADRHFVVREYSTKTYIVKVTKPAKRSKK